MQTNVEKEVIEWVQSYLKRPKSKVMDLYSMIIEDEPRAPMVFGLFNHNGPEIEVTSTASDSNQIKPR